VELSGGGIYGYDISTEILGLEGTLKIGYLRETTQLQNFAQNVLRERTPPITIEDGMEALRIDVAATRAHETGRSVVVSAIRA